MGDFIGKVVKTHIVDGINISLEACILDNTPCLVATIDFSPQSSVRYLRKRYRTATIDIAMDKVNNSTESDAKKLLASIKEAMDFTISLEKVLSSPQTTTANSEHQQAIKKLIAEKNKKLTR